MGIEDRISEIAEEVDDITSLIDGLASCLPESMLITLINTEKLSYRLANRLIEQHLKALCPDQKDIHVSNREVWAGTYWSRKRVSAVVRAEVKRLADAGLHRICISEGC